MSNTNNTNVIKFTAGRTYRTRSACDHNCIYGFVIIRRSAASVWIIEEGETKVTRRKITVYLGVETIMPHGRHSMAPVISADRPVFEVVR